MVRSAEDSGPIAGATVILAPLQNPGRSGQAPDSVMKKYGTLTSSEGKFELSGMPPSEYSLNVSMIGFHKYSTVLLFIENEKKSVSVAMQPAAIEADQVVVTASKREQLLTEVPVSLSLVSSSSMERRNTISLDDALRYVPGVNFVQDQANIRGSSGYARGIGSRVLLLVDGVPLLAGDTGEAVWEAVPISDIDHVEVMKGAGSALYGSNALGGVINVVTKDAGTGYSTQVKAYGGAYEQPLYSEWRWSSSPRFFEGGSVTHSQPMGVGDFGITTSLSYKGDDGYIQNDDFRRLDLFVKTAGTLGANENLKVFVNLFNQYSGNFLYWRDINHALQPDSSTLGEWVNTTRINLAGIYTHTLSNDFLYIVRASYYFNHWYDNFGQTPTGIGDTSSSNLAYVELQGILNASENTVLTFGVNGEADLINSNIFSTKQSGTTALYVQGERKFGGLHATLGARYDLEKIEGKAAFNQFNPKLGLVYDLGNDASLRGSVGTGFRAPSLGETYAYTQTGGVSIVPNPDLLPERSVSEEIGGRLPVGYVMLVDAAIFQSDYWNMIEPEFNSEGKISFQNVTRARVQGYELDLTSNAGTDFLTLKGSYTYIYPVDLTLDEILKYRSRELFYASASFEESIYRASVDFRFISKFENYDQDLVQLGIVRNGDQRVPAYVTDIRAGVDLTSVGYPFSATFIVNNVFDDYYVEMIGNIAPIRNYSLVLTMNF